MNAVTEVMDELRKALAELEDCRARNADLRTMLEQVTRERDEARTSCPDCAMWAERSARWHDDMQRAERERDEAQEAYREARASRWHVSKKWDEALKEIERLRTENRDMSRALTDAIEIQRNACTDAYRRGAEAMREACAQWFREHDESFELTVDACHDVIADMPIPEEP